MPVYDDPFRPKIEPPPSGEALAVSEEQKYNIQLILSYSCSDSRFAQKAYAGIMYILEGPQIEGTIPPEPQFDANPPAVKTAIPRPSRPTVE